MTTSKDKDKEVKVTPVKDTKKVSVSKLNWMELGNTIEKEVIGKDLTAAKWTYTQKVQFLNAMVLKIVTPELIKEYIKK